ncbi:MAG: flippase-like domain-containing protein [Acidobacteriia bacterium]|nr:flippase-like domain-containing protein [Terriglobia bacterium]
MAIWLLYRALYSRGFDWRLVRSSFAHVRWIWFFLAVLFIYASYWGRALRWAVFLKPLRARPSMRNLLTATVIGFTAITLLGRPGEFVRPYLIAIKEKVPVTSQLAAWFLERMFDLLMSLVLFGFALGRITSSGVALGPQLSWVLSVGGRLIGFASVALLIILILFRHFAEPARRWILRSLEFLSAAKLARAEKLVSAFVQGVESTRSDAALVLVLTYSVLEWALITGCFWCLATSFADINLSIVDVLILIGFVSLGGVIQIPGVGGGVQVVVILLLTELFGIRLELATTFAFLVWILTFVAIVPAGVLMMLKEGLDWQKLRRLDSAGPV